MVQMQLYVRVTILYGQLIGIQILHFTEPKLLFLVFLKVWTLSEVFHFKVNRSYWKPYFMSSQFLVWWAAFEKCGIWFEIYIKRILVDQYGTKLKFCHKFWCKHPILNLIKTWCVVFFFFRLTFIMWILCLFCTEETSFSTSRLYSMMATLCDCRFIMLVRHSPLQNHCFF